MSTPKEGTFSSPRMFLLITRAEDGEKTKDLFSAMNVPICYQCRGQGTAPSEALDLFGLGGTARLITTGFLPKSAVGELFEKIDRKFNIHKKGRGVAVTIPLTGMQRPMLHLLKDEVRTRVEEKMTERIKEDMDEIHEKSRYHAVLAAVAAGCSDEVIDAARAAGAKGGTILRGRRRNSERISEYFGIPMQDEQDFVLIIVTEKIKNEVMSSISHLCGLHTSAHGVVISLPIDEVMGLEE